MRVDTMCKLPILLCFVQACASHKTCMQRLLHIDVAAITYVRAHPQDLIHLLDYKVPKA